MASEHTDGTRTSPREYLSALWVALTLVVGGFLAANLVSLPLLAVFSALGVSLESTPGYVASTLLQNVAFVGVVFAYMRYADLPDLLDVRWPSTARLGRGLRDFGWVLAGLVVLVVASRAVALALQSVGLAPGTNQIVNAVENDPTLALYLVVLSFLATGPGEEILFRGGVQGVLRRVLSPAPAIVVSSALFGLAHVTATIATSSATGVWGYVITTFLLGLILGGLYEYTGNLLVPAVIHGAYNAITFAQLYAHETMALHWSWFLS